MKDNAFTLVELLVVIAIIALLVGIITPSFNGVQEYTKATICQGQLSRIAQVFTTSNTKTLINTSARDGSLDSPYPDRNNWPDPAITAVKAPGLFKCPKDDRKSVPIEDLHGRVEFRSTWGGGVAIPLSGLVSSGFVLSRKGPNYIEYVFEEAGDITQAFWNLDPSQHNDGYLRFWNDGTLEVLSCTCGGDNQLWIDNKPAFGPNNYQIRPNVGAKIKTGFADAVTSYGINIYAHDYPYSGKVVVLLDYTEKQADPDNSAKTRELLMASRRHLNRMNVLMSDASVTALGAVELDPILARTLWWNPQNKLPHD